MGAAILSVYVNYATHLRHFQATLLERLKIYIYIYIFIIILLIRNGALIEVGWFYKKIKFKNKTNILDVYNN